MSSEFHKVIERRVGARLAATQALYQHALNDQPIDRVIGEFVTQRLGTEIDEVRYRDADPDFFADLARGAIGRRDEIDALLLGALDKRPPDRLETLLLAILRLGVYELLAHPEVPAQVVISEWVDIAHGFFGGTEPGLVNAVLDKIARECRATEFTAASAG